MRKLHLGRQQRLGRQPAAPRFRRLRSEPLETRQMLTITVDTLTDEADGSIDDGDVSLRDAIALAPSGETIDFSVTGTILLTLGELLIDKDLTIDGPGAELLTIDASGNDPTPDSTLDDGDDTNDGDGSRVFNVDDGDDLHNVTVAVGGLAITGGDVDGDGGGVLSKENLALVDAVVNHNNVGDSGRPNGGGIMAYVWNEGTLTIDGTRISYNSASLGGRGGGMYVEIATGGTAAISDSIVTSNSTGGRGDGGGIYAHTDGGVFFISHTSISDNGGGAYRGGGYRGGGIFAVTTNQARLSITDSNISDNYTFFADDGAIWLETTAHSRVTISRSVISDNSSDGIVADSDGGSTLTLARTVISGNEGKGVQADGRTWILNSVVLDNFGTGLSLDSIGSPFDTSSPSIFVSRTTVAGNESGGGMILNATGGAVEVRDSTVSRNTGSGIGGILVGLHAYRVLITHTTITDNAGGR